MSQGWKIASLKSCALEKAPQVDLWIFEALRLGDQLDLCDQVIPGFDHEGGEMIDVIDRHLRGQRSRQLNRPAEPRPQTELEVGLELDPSAEELACAWRLRGRRSTVSGRQSDASDPAGRVRRTPAAGVDEPAAARISSGPSSASVSRPPGEPSTIDVIAMR